MAAYNLEWLHDSISSSILQDKLSLLEVEPTSNQLPTYCQVVEIESVAELNMLVSSCRERSEGRVVFRGQPKLFGILPYPTAYRNDPRHPHFSTGAVALLRALSSDLPVNPNDPFDTEAKFNQILEDGNFVRNLQTSNRGVPWYAFEGLVQQYFGGTRWLDVVDSLWIAVWMASRSYVPRETPQRHHDFELPVTTVSAIWNRNEPVDSVFLYFFDCGVEVSTGFRGYSKSEGLEVLDLRVALPGQFLRPHSQHAMLMRFTDLNSTEPVILAVAKISLDLAREIIGDSTLLSTGSIFPPPEDDKGFSTLLRALNMYGAASVPSWRLEKSALPPVYKEEDRSGSTSRK